MWNYKKKKDKRKGWTFFSLVCFMQNCPGEIFSASYISLTRDLCSFGNSAFFSVASTLWKTKNKQKKKDKNENIKKNTGRKTVVYQLRSCKALVFSWDVSNWIKQCDELSNWDYVSWFSFFYCVEIWLPLWRKYSASSAIIYCAMHSVLHSQEGGRVTIYKIKQYLWDLNELIIVR